MKGGVRRVTGRGRGRVAVVGNRAKEGASREKPRSVGIDRASAVD